MLEVLPHRTSHHIWDICICHARSNNSHRCGTAIATCDSTAATAMLVPLHSLTFHGKLQAEVSRLLSVVAWVVMHQWRYLQPASAAVPSHSKTPQTEVSVAQPSLSAWRCQSEVALLQLQPLAQALQAALG